MKQEDELGNYLKNCVRIGINEAVTKLEKTLNAERKKSKAKDAALKAKDADLKAKDARLVINSYEADLPVETIAIITGLTIEEVMEIIETNIDA